MVKLFATAGYDHSIRLWKIGDSNSSFCSLQHPESQVNDISFSGDEKYLAAAGYKYIRIYDITNIKNNVNPIISLNNSSEKNFVKAGFIPENSALLYGVGEDGPLVLLDQRASTSMQTKLKKVITNVTLTNAFMHLDQMHLVCASREGKIFIWDIRNNAIDTFIPEPQSQICCMATDASCKYIAVGNDQGLCSIWPMETIITQAINNNTPSDKEQNVSTFEVVKHTAIMLQKQQMQNENQTGHPNSVKYNNTNNIMANNIFNLNFSVSQDTNRHHIRSLKKSPHSSTLSYNGGLRTCLPNVLYMALHKSLQLRMYEFRTPLKCIGSPQHQITVGFSESESNSNSKNKKSGENFAQIRQNKKDIVNNDGPTSDDEVLHCNDENGNLLLQSFDNFNTNQHCFQSKTEQMNQYVLNCTFSPDAKYVATCTYKGQTLVWRNTFENSNNHDESFKERLSQNQGCWKLEHPAVNKWVWCSRFLSSEFSMPVDLNLDAKINKHYNMNNAHGKILTSYRYLLTACSDGKARLWKLLNSGDAFKTIGVKEYSGHRKAIICMDIL